MATTLINATDEMFTIVKAVTDDVLWLTVFGYPLDVRWPGNGSSRKPDMDKVWVRVSKQTVSDGQASLANANGEQIYECTGLLFIQLFCPRNQPKTMQNGRQLAVALQRAFYPQSPTGEIWFRNSTVRELPETPDNFPINVVITFQYQTLKSGATNGAVFVPPQPLSQVLALIPFTPVADGIVTDFTLAVVPAFLLIFGDGLLMTGIGSDYTLVGNLLHMMNPPESLIILGA